MVCREGDVGTWRHGAGDGNGKRRVRADSQWVGSGRGTAGVEGNSTPGGGSGASENDAPGWVGGGRYAGWMDASGSPCCWMTGRKRETGSNGICGCSPIYLISGPHTPRRGLITVHLYVSQSPGRTQRAHAN